MNTGEIDKQITIMQCVCKSLDEHPIEKGCTTTIETEWDTKKEMIIYHNTIKKLLNKLPSKYDHMLTLIPKREGFNHKVLIMSKY